MSSVEYRDLVPLRIAVKGASTVCVKSPVGDDRARFTFPRALERQLWSRGFRNNVRELTLPGEPTSGVLRDWVGDYLGWAPDVVIFMVGHYETIHLLWPRWLERHAHSLTARSRPIRRWYRERVLRQVWRRLGRIQCAIDTRVPPGVKRRRLQHAADDLMVAVEQIRRYSDPLVLVMEIPRPGAKARNWFPGMTARVDLMNSLMADAVQRMGSENVRMFRTNAVIAAWTSGDADSGVLDGFHFTSNLHDAVGIELAGIIEPWVLEQAELRIPRL